MGRWTSLFFIVQRRFRREWRNAEQEIRRRLGQMTSYHCTLESKEYLPTCPAPSKAAAPQDRSNPWPNAPYSPPQPVRDGRSLHGFSSIVYQPPLRLWTDETEEIAWLSIVVVPVWPLTVAISRPGNLERRLEKRSSSTGPSNEFASFGSAGIKRTGLNVFAVLCREVSLKRALYRAPSYFRFGRTNLRSDMPCAYPDDPPRTSSPSWHLRCLCSPSCSFSNRQITSGVADRKRSRDRCYAPKEREAG